MSNIVIEIGGRFYFNLENIFYMFYNFQNLKKKELKLKLYTISKCIISMYF